MSEHVPDVPAMLAERPALQRDACDRALAYLASVAGRPVAPSEAAVAALPFTAVYPIGPGGFAILGFAPARGTALGGVVYVEHLTGQGLFENEAGDVRVPAGV